MPTRTLQSNFSGGILSPGLFGRVDINKYNSGMERCKNWLPQVQGGVITRPGMKFVGEATEFGSQATRLIPFVFSSEQSYMLVFSASVMKIIKDGAFVVYPSGHPSAGQIVEIVSPYTVLSELPLIKYTQISDTMYLNNQKVARYKLQRTDHHLWTFTLVSETVQVTPAAPTVGSSSVTAPNKTYSYKVSAVDINGVESGVQAIGTSVVVTHPWPAGAEVTMFLSATVGAEYFKIYKNSNGFYGYIGKTDTTVFIDNNIEPDSAGIPVAATTEFLTADDNPGAVGMFEQRLFNGGSNNQPQTVIASQTALIENYRVSPGLLDTDYLNYTLFSELSERIRHFVSMEKMLVFTSESEKVLDHGANTDALTPTSVKVRTRSRFGCSEVKPAVVGSEVMFVQRRGKIIYNFFYSLEQDGYASNDLTILSPMLFKDVSVVDMAFQKASGILWVVMSDGTMRTLTYDKAQQVWAWATHETTGNVQNVGVIEGEDTTEVYVIVERTNNTKTFNSVELLYSGDRTAPETSFCVDSGLEYDGVPATIISELEHLAGLDVAVLADGGVVPDMTVSATGTITLPFSASKVIAGLGFQCDMIPLRLNIPSRTGTIQGSFKVIDKVVMRLWNTRGLKLGNPEGELVEMKDRGQELYGDPSGLKSGDVPLVLKDFYNREGQIRVVQDYPLPAEITALISEVELED